MRSTINDDCSLRSAVPKTCMEKAQSAPFHLSDITIEKWWATAPMSDSLLQHPFFDGATHLNAILTIEAAVLESSPCSTSR